MEKKDHSQEQFVKAILQAVIFVRGIPYFPWNTLKALQISAIRRLVRAIKIKPSEVEHIKDKLIELKKEIHKNDNRTTVKAFMHLVAELVDELYDQHFPNKP